MNPLCPVTVGIPTFDRGERIFGTIRRILQCDPRPSEIIVHVDASDGTLEERIARQFSEVRILSSSGRVGPGGGRHRCIAAAVSPHFASFDDDSWPIDKGYFNRVLAHFAADSRVALVAAIVSHRGMPIPPEDANVKRAVNYTGCGYALRTAVYKSLTGHLDREIPYGFEEIDLAIQMHDARWKVLQCADLRVYHDTNLAHHPRAEITAGTIQNALLLAWVRYPVTFWPYAILQCGNVIRAMIRARRFKGILTGLTGVPRLLSRYRSFRMPASAESLRSYLRYR